MIEQRLKHRPYCPKRRLVIPFVTCIPDDGSPIKFAVEDRARVALCGHKKLCQLCGASLDAVIVFTGGETATKQGIFRQAPFHEDCMRFALDACPYLRRTDDPQFATFCRRFEFSLCAFPLTVPGQTTVIKAFVAKAIIRVESVSRG